MWLKIGIGIFIIAAIALGGSFFTDYNSLNSQAASLQPKIQTDTNTLKTLTNGTQQAILDITSLNAQINTANNSIALEQKVIPAKMDSNEIVGNILTRAQVNNVNVLPLSTKDWSPLRLGNSDYQVLRMAIEITGQQADIIHYVGTVQADLYPTLAIDNLTVSEEVDTNGNPYVKADLDFSIYAK